MAGFLGFDPIAVAKKEILKLDANKDGVPDAIEAIHGLEGFANFLFGLVSKLDESDVAEIVGLIPAGIQAKIGVEALAKLPALVVAFPAQLASIVKVLSTAETELKS